MKKKIKLSVFIIVAIVFVILYLFFAARPLTQEYQYTPEWKINTLNPVISQEDSQSAYMYFRFGQNLGYFNQDGKISLFKTFPFNASISDSYYAIYNADAVNTPFFYPDGTQAGTIQAAGYPYFKGDQIYVFLPGGSSFAKCSQEGKIEWQYEGVLPVTAFTTNQNFVAAGFADGTIKVFDIKNGQNELSYTPGGSDYSVVVGLDISPDGEYIASISGHDKQRFVLSHKEDSNPRIVFHSFIDDGTPYRTLVRFFNNGKSVIYNFKDTIGIYDIEQDTNKTINIQSRIIRIEETENLLFLLGRKDNSYTVYIIEKTNSLEGSFSFEAESAFISTDKNYLYVGKDNTISKISITRE